MSLCQLDHVSRAVQLVCKTKNTKEHNDYNPLNIINIYGLTVMRTMRFENRIISEILNYILGIFMFYAMY